jgi:hypothetical protein
MAHMELDGASTKLAFTMFHFESYYLNIFTHTFYPYRYVLNSEITKRPYKEVKGMTVQDVMEIVNKTPARVYLPKEKTFYRMQRSWILDVGNISFSKAVSMAHYFCQTFSLIFIFLTFLFDLI